MGADLSCQACTAAADSPPTSHAVDLVSTVEQRDHVEASASEGSIAIEAEPSYRGNSFELDHKLLDFRAALQSSEQLDPQKKAALMERYDNDVLSPSLADAL
eukprot:SAG31_NODE_12955_length_904_cov_1.592547_1_plen_101_part_10